MLSLNFYLNIDIVKASISLIIERFFLKKKMAHAYLSARIFSKSFGGKIEKFSAEVVHRNNFWEKKWRMRI